MIKDSSVIYLDNNASTKVAPEVKAAMLPFFSEQYGNPSSLHDFGTEARKAVEESRSEIARFLGIKLEREIIFTSGGTESNHTAIDSALKCFPGRKRLVTTQVEHSSIRTFCGQLQREGYEVISIGVSESGAIDWDTFLGALTEEVALVSVMWANNETGVLFPIQKIAEVVKKKGILLHVDAMQAVGKLSIQLSQIPIDLLSCSGHKFHGPKGIGMLYVREGTPFEPLFVGGRQERDRRAGTENVPGIMGLAAALRLAQDTMTNEMPRVANLRDKLETGLLSEIPDSFINGRKESRIPNTTNMTIPGVEAEALLIRLSQAGISASSGSACLTGALEPSHVLEAMGLSSELASSSLRFSLSRYTTSVEIDQAIEIVSKLARQLRKLSRAEK
ncbi:MAG: aminotransferase class V-fold PLP-dependent enzyme [Candidatus Omnitrophica bacterium]|nr:aminotransferase class V-fold PLP-dependent enzyme [Candidatus Omnitrophota bacterium]